MRNPFKPQDDGLIRDEDGTPIAVHVGGTTLDEQMRAAFTGAPSVEITPGGDIHGVEEKLTPEQKHVDQNLRWAGMTYNTEGKYVRLPPPPAGQNQKLFQRTEAQLTRGLSLRETFKVLEAFEDADGRAQLAEFLARRGMLEPNEVAHLQWLATAKDPVDDVLPGTTPITGEQARRIVAIHNGGGA